MAKKVFEVSNHFCCHLKTFPFYRIPLAVFYDWYKTMIALILSKDIVATKNTHGKIL